MRCQNCGKGKDYGHNVSHAKNRTRRLFLPNLQKLKVFKSGVSIRVLFCTSCIKRLRKDGRIGNYFLLKAKPETKVELPKLPSMKVEKSDRKIEKEKAKEALDIASIVGKKN